MRLMLALLALLALAASVQARDHTFTIEIPQQMKPVPAPGRKLLQEVECEFAPLSAKSAIVEAGIIKTTGVQSSVKYLFNNQKCTDFVLCVGDDKLSDGNGCTLVGDTSANVCSLKGTEQADGTYTLTSDPTCTGMDLMNCLTVKRVGFVLEVSQTCGDKIGSISFTCQSCSTGALAPARRLLQANANDTAPDLTCNKGWCGKCDYECDCNKGWCGKCDYECDKDYKKSCWAKCTGGKANCRITDEPTCTAKDTTRCTPLNGDVTCIPRYDPPPPSPVACPAFRATVTLKLERQQIDRDGKVNPEAWQTLFNNLLVETRGEPNTYTSQQPEVTPDCDGGSAGRAADGSLAAGPCTCTKSGSCGARLDGSCTATKVGDCKAKGYATAGDLITCPATGGTYFYPCDGSTSCYKDIKGK